MADSAMDLDLIRRTAICVKALETAADEKDYVNFLTPARELSDNVVRLVTLATQFNLVAIAAELRERVKQAMAEAKTLLREKSDASLDRFKGLLRQVAKVLVSIMNELKQIKASGGQPQAIPPTSPSPVRPLANSSAPRNLERPLAAVCLHSPPLNADLHPLFEPIFGVFPSLSFLLTHLFFLPYSYQYQSDLLLNVWDFDGLIRSCQQAIQHSKMRRQMLSC